MKERITKSDRRNRQQWGILDNDRSIDSVIGEGVPANIRASSRGKTEGASVIHKEKASKGWEAKGSLSTQRRREKRTGSIRRIVEFSVEGWYL